MDPKPLAALPPTFGATTAALHLVAEQLVAPARKPDNEIALTVTPGGFGTPLFEFGGARRQVRIEGAELVHLVGPDERRAPLTSLSRAGEAIAELLPAGALDSAPLAVDPEASRALGTWYRFGADVLNHMVARADAEGEPTPPRLWPEHFDIAIELDRKRAALAPTTGSRLATRTIPSPMPTSDPGRRRSPASYGARPASTAPSWPTLS